MARVAQAEYARHRGVSKQMIGKLVKAGRIRLVDGKVDIEEADAVLNGSLDPSRGGKGGGPDRRIPDDRPPAPEGLVSFAEARAEREYYAAQREKNAYRKEIGETAEVERVRAGASGAFGAVKTSLGRIADKLAPQLAAEMDAKRIRVMLIEEIDNTLRELADAIEALPEQLTATHQ